MLGIKAVYLAAHNVEEVPRAVAAAASFGHVWWPLQFVGSSCGGQVDASASDIGSHMPRAGDPAYLLTKSWR